MTGACAAGGSATASARKGAVLGPSVSAGTDHSFEATTAGSDERIRMQIRSREDPTAAAAAATCSSKVVGEVGSGPSSSSLGSGLPPRGDTENLIAELFNEVGTEDRDGSSFTVLSSGVAQQQMPGLVEPNSPSVYPPKNARREIQRQMEELREELRDGQSQWEVHEQIGKGGFGVVYKVGDGWEGQWGCRQRGRVLSSQCEYAAMTKPILFSLAGHVAGPAGGHQACHLPGKPMQ